MYDPTVGRWLEEDPMGFAAGQANLFEYVGNDPTNGIDPSGLAVAAAGLVGNAVVSKSIKDNPLSNLELDPSPGGTFAQQKGQQAALVVENRLAPPAIKLGAEKALKNLKITGVNVGKGDANKAVLSLKDYNAIKSQAGGTLKPVKTISGDSAEEIDLGGGYALKIYQQGGNYYIAVVTTTNTADHWADAWKYLQSGGGTVGPGPNGGIAERYLGQPVYDFTTVKQLQALVKNGSITLEEYLNIIDNGIDVSE